MACGRARTRLRHYRLRRSGVFCVDRVHIFFCSSSSRESGVQRRHPNVCPFSNAWHTHTAVLAVNPSPLPEHVAVFHLQVQFPCFFVFVVEMNGTRTSAPKVRPYAEARHLCVNRSILCATCCMNEPSRARLPRPGLLPELGFRREHGARACACGGCMCRVSAPHLTEQRSTLQVRSAYRKPIRI